MIKAALSNIPVYYMSMFKMPCKVANIIENFQMDFLWDGGGCKKDHLVKWEIVVKPKSQGGLGVGRMKDRNLALLGK